ncbi:hypothetical protein BESB_003470 [Besnoitia besnoiti]|uniref:TBC domain-containing kinase (Incomplete catalytic triad) n=1 Tax=Besnoitia besnoiti TaxID=94643 RepID=A0A2A9MNZ0_BESBE|nr:hypothetical protein BESB_003470 [Besnoitia besnoiti]PFH38006.1 hypothetical protein BESB_003470 [Besnoitia besnoiti]
MATSSAFKSACEAVEDDVFSLSSAASEFLLGFQTFAVESQPFSTRSLFEACSRASGLQQHGSGPAEGSQGGIPLEALLPARIPQTETRGGGGDWRPKSCGDSCASLNGHGRALPRGAPAADAAAPPGGDSPQTRPPVAPASTAFFAEESSALPVEAAAPGGEEGAALGRRGPQRNDSAAADEDAHETANEKGRGFRINDRGPRTEGDSVRVEEAEAAYRQVVTRFQFLKQLRHPFLCSYTHILRKAERFFVVSEYWSLSLADLIHQREQALGARSPPSSASAASASPSPQRRSAASNSASSAARWLASAALLPEAFLRRMAAQILSALAFLNEQGLTHGRLCPSTIRFTADGDVRLSDWGLNYLLHRGSLSPHTRLLPCPPFLTPQQALFGAEVSAVSPPFSKDDSWALGAALLQAAQGPPRLQPGVLIALLAQARAEAKEKAETAERPTALDKAADRAEAHSPAHASTGPEAELQTGYRARGRDRSWSGERQGFRALQGELGLRERRALGDAEGEEGACEAEVEAWERDWQREVDRILGFPIPVGGWDDWFACEKRGRDEGDLHYAPRSREEEKRLPHLHPLCTLRAIEHAARMLLYVHWAYEDHVRPHVDEACTFLFQNGPEISEAEDAKRQGNQGRREGGGSRGRPRRSDEKANGFGREPAGRAGRQLLWRAASFSCIGRSLERRLLQHKERLVAELRHVVSRPCCLVEPEAYAALLAALSACLEKRKGMGDDAADSEGTKRAWRAPNSQDEEGRRQLSSPCSSWLASPAAKGWEVEETFLWAVLCSQAGWFSGGALFSHALSPSLLHVSSLRSSGSRVAPQAPARCRPSRSARAPFSPFSSGFRDLLRGLLEVNPGRRFSPAEAASLACSREFLSSPCQPRLFGGSQGAKVSSLASVKGTDAFSQPARDRVRGGRLEASKRETDGDCGRDNGREVAEEARNESTRRQPERTVLPTVVEKETLLARPRAAEAAGLLLDLHIDDTLEAIRSGASECEGQLCHDSLLLRRPQRRSTLRLVRGGRKREGLLVPVPQRASGRDFLLVAAARRRRLRDARRPRRISPRSADSSPPSVLSPSSAPHEYSLGALRASRRVGSAAHASADKPAARQSGRVNVSSSSPSPRTTSSGSPAALASSPSSSAASPQSPSSSPPAESSQEGGVRWPQWAGGSHDRLPFLSPLLDLRLLHDFCAAPARTLSSGAEAKPTEGFQACSCLSLASLLPPASQARPESRAQRADATRRQREREGTSSHEGLCSLESADRSPEAGAEETLGAVGLAAGQSACERARGPLSPREGGRGGGDEEDDEGEESERQAGRLLQGAVEDRSFFACGFSAGRNWLDVEGNWVEGDARIRGVCIHDTVVALQEADRFSISQMHEVRPRCLYMRQFHFLYQRLRVRLFRSLLVQLPKSLQRLTEEAAVDIPPLLRPQIWAALLGVNYAAEVAAGPFVFDQLVLEGLAMPEARQLTSEDFSQCFEHHDLLGSRFGRRQLRRLLQALFAHCCRMPLSLSPPRSPRSSGGGSAHLASVSAAESRAFVSARGLDAIAAPLQLLYGGQPQVALACLDRLLTRQSQFKLFGAENAAAIEDQLACFSQLLYFFDPLLATHLQAIGLGPDLYALSWLLTLFAHALDLPQLFLLWDSLLLHPPSFVLFVAVCLVHHLRVPLLQLAPDEESSALSLLRAASAFLHIPALCGVASSLERETPVSVALRFLARKSGYPLQAGDEAGDAAEGERIQGAEEEAPARLREGAGNQGGGKTGKGGRRADEEEPAEGDATAQARPHRKAREASEPEESSPSGGAARFYIGDEEEGSDDDASVASGATSRERLPHLSRMNSNQGRGDVKNKRKKKQSLVAAMIQGPAMMLMGPPRKPLRALESDEDDDTSTAQPTESDPLQSFMEEERWWEAPVDILSAHAQPRRSGPGYQDGPECGGGSLGVRARGAYCPPFLTVDDLVEHHSHTTVLDIRPVKSFRQLHFINAKNVAADSPSSALAPLLASAAAAANAMGAPFPGSIPCPGGSESETLAALSASSGMPSSPFSLGRHPSSCLSASFASRISSFPLGSARGSAGAEKPAGAGAPVQGSTADGSGLSQKKDEKKASVGERYGPAAGEYPAKSLSHSPKLSNPHSGGVALPESRATVYESGDEPQQHATVLPPWLKGDSQKIHLIVVTGNRADWGVTLATRLQRAGVPHVCVLRGGIDALLADAPSCFMETGNAGKG